MKKIIALLLVLALSFTLLAGCGGNTAEDNGDDAAVSMELTAEALEGKWTMVVNTNKVLSAATNLPGLGSLAGEEGMDIESMLEAFEDIDLGQMEIGVDFTAAGEMVTSAEDCIDAVIGMLDKYFAWLGEGDNLYEFVAKTSGMSKDAVKKEFESLGMSIDAYLEIIKTQFDSMKETMKASMDEIVAEMGKTYYELKDNVLSIWSDGEDKIGYQFTYNGGSIYVTAITDGGSTTTLEKGAITFTK